MMIAHHAGHGAEHDGRHGAAGATPTKTTTARGVRHTAWSIASIVVALLAGQHHALHMLLLTLGGGRMEAGFLALFPAVRRLMLLLSLAMAGATLCQHWRHRPPPAVRALGLVSAALTFGLLVWSLGTYGW